MKCLDSWLPLTSARSENIYSDHNSHYSSYRIYSSYNNNRDGLQLQPVSNI